MPRLIYTKDGKMFDKNGNLIVPWVITGAGGEYERCLEGPTGEEGGTIEKGVRDAQTMGVSE